MHSCLLINTFVVSSAHNQCVECGCEPTAVLCAKYPAA